MEEINYVCLQLDGCMGAKKKEARTGPKTGPKAQGSIITPSEAIINRARETFSLAIFF